MHHRRTLRTDTAATSAAVLRSTQRKTRAVTVAELSHAVSAWRNMSTRTVSNVDPMQCLVTTATQQTREPATAQPAEVPAASPAPSEGASASGATAEGSQPSGESQSESGEAARTAEVSPDSSSRSCRPWEFWRPEWWLTNLDGTE